MGLLTPGEGTWTTLCQQDARFNMSGRAGSVRAAGIAINLAIQRKARELAVTDEYLDSLTISTGFVKD